MKWTVKVRLNDGEIHTIQVTCGMVEGLPIALKSIAKQKKITMKDIVSVEPHSVIKTNQST